MGQYNDKCITGSFLTELTEREYCLEIELKYMSWLLS
jgi:hypothetical protein